MSRTNRFRFFAAMVIALLCGCTPGTKGTGGRAAQSSANQAALAEQARILTEQNRKLDQDNQQHTQLLADSQHRVRRLEDQVKSIQQQLTDTANQLSRVKNEKVAVERRVEALGASAKRRGGAEISSNNSLKAGLPALDIPDVHVRQDGDVIRIELPADSIFQRGTAQIQTTAVNLIDTVAAEILRTYPNQIVGVEGHTERDPVRSAQFASDHQLATARANSVFAQLAAGGRLRPDQLFLMSHGSNRPLYSNASPEGRARNRRIELVIYPDKPLARQ